MLHAEKWESLVREVTCAALGMGQVNERRRGTKPRTAKRHAFLKFQVISDISGWSQRAVANRYNLLYLYKSICTDASLASQASD